MGRLLAEIRASKALLLATNSVDEGRRRNLSGRERARLVQILRSGTWTALDLAEASEAICESTFAEEDKQLLIEAVADADVTGPEMVAVAGTGVAALLRTKSQDWSSLVPKILTKEVWTACSEDDIAPLFRHLALLGLLFIVTSEPVAIRMIS